MFRFLAVGQHRAGRGASGLVGRNDGFDLRILVQPPFRRGAAFELGDDARFRLRQRDQHRADIAHRGDMKLTPQPSGAAAVIRHGDDRRDLNILNEFNAAQDDRLAMPAADNDDLQRVIVHPAPAYRDVLYSSYTGSYSDHTGNS